MTPIGKAGIIESAHISPDGKNLLVTTIHRPFSYLHAAREFPKEIEVWDRTGKVLHNVSLAEAIGSITFANDSRHLAVTLATGVVYILRLGPPANGKI